MDATRLPAGGVALTVKSDELAGVRQSLNEVCNGYEVPDFKRRIGVEEDAARRLLDQTTRRNPAKVATLGDDTFRVTFSPDEARIVINAMRDTLREFTPGEFETRMGLERQEAEQIISLLESALRP